jgi:hypothetical protein
METKKKLKGTDVALITIAILDVIFVAFMVWLFYLYQAVPDSLIAAVFGVTFGECGFCTLVYKIKKGVKTDGIHGAELPAEDQTNGDPRYAEDKDLGVIDSGSGIHRVE